jgi:hypothetical protein
MSKPKAPAVVSEGDQRVIAITTFNEEGEAIVEELQSWIDAGWRCTSLTRLDHGLLVALFEARSAAAVDPRGY